MNARLGLEIKRLTHFIEARRNACLAKSLRNELEKFVLLRGKHR
jgi:hypothetical protein